MTEALCSTLFPVLFATMTSSDFLKARLSTPFFLTYTASQQTLPDWSSSLKFTLQDLPSSLLKPMSGSCRLHNGGHTASKQVTAVLITLPSQKVLLPTTYRGFVTSMAIHFHSSP